MNNRDTRNTKKIVKCVMMSVITMSFVVSSAFFYKSKAETVDKTYDIWYEHECGTTPENIDLMNSQQEVVAFFDSNQNEIAICDNGNILLEQYSKRITECDFDGWYYDTEYTEKVTGSTVGDAMKPKQTYSETLDNNMCLTYVKYVTKLYAKCKNDTPTPTCSTDVDKSYKVHYMVDGTEVQSKTLIYGVNESLNISYDAPDGKTFDGWYVDSAYTNKLSALTTDKLNVIEKKNAEDCVIGYNDVYLYAKLLDTSKTCPNIDNMEYIVHYIVDGTEVGTDTVKKGTNKELMKYKLSSSNCTLSSWYIDKELTNTITSNNISDISVNANLDIDNCVVSYDDVYVYATTTCETQKNPETGDNIVIYIVGGIIFIAGTALVTKKLLNK